MASTSNRPAEIATLNEASEGMNPHQRVHPMGATTTSFLTDFQMDGILRGLRVKTSPVALFQSEGSSVLMVS